MKATTLLFSLVVLPVLILSYCDPASAEVVAELQTKMLEEAQECVMAKEELLAAATDDAVDRALRKISMLCDT